MKQTPLLSAAGVQGSGCAIPDNNPNGGSSVFVEEHTNLFGPGFFVNVIFGPEPTWMGDLVATLSHDDGSTTVTADFFRRGGKTSAETGFGDSNDLNGLCRFKDSFADTLWNAPTQSRGRHYPQSSSQRQSFQRRARPGSLPGCDLLQPNNRNFPRPHHAFASSNCPGRSALLRTRTTGSPGS